MFNKSHHLSGHGSAVVRHHNAARIRSNTQNLIIRRADDAAALSIHEIYRGLATPQGKNDFVVEIRVRLEAERQAPGRWILCRASASLA